jgi:ferric-dicitrate binding protein FerR (iron transport regulator)
MFGTVEIKTPGSAVWQAAATGQELEQESVVSTGFRSTAVIRVGNSTIMVRPLTRLSLREMYMAANAGQVEIDLRAGRIRADVQPPLDGSVEFMVRSPVTNASVRGTVFEFDTLNLRVEEGTVAFSGIDNTRVYVGAGQSSFPDAISGKTAIPVESAATQGPPPPAGVENIATQPPAVIPGPIPQISVGVNVNWEN